jgi:hypothetical protein
MKVQMSNCIIVSISQDSGISYTGNINRSIYKIDINQSKILIDGYPPCRSKLFIPCISEKPLELIRNSNRELIFEDIGYLSLYNLQFNGNKYYSFTPALNLKELKLVLKKVEKIYTESSNNPPKMLNDIIIIFVIAFIIISYHYMNLDYFYK